jgi:small subunit ribosomal protein S20
MANLKSSKKRAIQNKKRRGHNLARRSALKTVTKQFVAAIEAQDVVKAQELLKLAQSSIARAKGKRVLKANTASRKVGTLAKRLNTLQKKSS